MGAHFFLACADPLQRGALPLLTTQDFFRLRCTSIAMQQWLLGCPASIWQVIPGLHGVAACDMSVILCPHVKLVSALQNLPGGDASPGYLNSLPTTAAVLAATRSAHTARLRIAQGSAPTGTAVLDFGAQPEGGLTRVPLYPAFSACGRHLAMLLHGKLGLGYAPTDIWAPYRPSRPPGMQKRHDLALFTVDATRLRLHSDHFRAACRPPAFSWAPDLPHLSVVWFSAAEKAPEDDLAGVIFCVLVLDAANGEVVHELSDGVAKHLFHAWCRAHTQHEWSPSGRYLLVTCHADMGAVPHVGRLTIIDVWGDEMVAFSDFAMQSWVEVLAVAVWHPSSRAIILSDGVRVEQPESLAAAGFVVGTLPKACFIAAHGCGARFSPDGASLVVRVCDMPQSIDSYEEVLAMQDSTDFSILSCSFVEDSISFVTQRTSCGRECQWLPCSSRLLCSSFNLRSFSEPEEDVSTVLNLHDQAKDVVVQGTSLVSAVCHPSSTITVDSIGPLRVHDMVSGQ